MTREQHLLVCLAEECSEVVKEATKILRFGLIEEGDELRHTTLKGRAVEPNGPRLEQEIVDVLAVVDMLFQECEFFDILDAENQDKMEIAIKAKQKKIEAYMEKAHEYGQLEVK